jgi:ABC-type amino acid transport system permease subunit
VPGPADGKRTRISPSPSGCSAGKKELFMLAFVAAVLCAIAFLIYATSTSTSTSTITALSPTSLLLAGLARLALHVVGIGTGWSVPARRSRR